MGVVYLLVGSINAIYVQNPLRNFIRQQDVSAAPQTANMVAVFP